jgi:hypothetical protein
MPCRFFFLVPANSPLAQDYGEGDYGMPAGTDSIEAVYVEGIYFYQPKAEYLALYSHQYADGPSLGSPLDAKVETDYYVKALSIDGTEVKGSYSATWIQGGPKGLERLKIAEYFALEYPGESGDLHYRLGSKRLDEDLRAELWDVVEAYQGQKGDLLLVVGNQIVGENWGYMDHTQQGVKFFRPPFA